MWQLQRLSYKNQRLAAIKESIFSQEQPTYSLKQAKHQKYDKVTLNGWFEEKNIFVFARRKVKSTEYGYIVLTPFRLENGEVVLVSRGIAADSDRSRISNSTDKQHIIGLLMDSERAKMFDPENLPEQNLWFTINLDELSRSNNADYGSYYVMQLSGESEYIEEFRPNELISIYNPHLGYAITWFSIAAAIAAIFVVSIRTQEAKK